MIKAEKQIAKVRDLIIRLKKEGSINEGYCATGIRNDYQHSHSWASDCHQCVERSKKKEIAELLEKTLED